VAKVTEFNFTFKVDSAVLEWLVNLNYLEVGLKIMSKTDKTNIWKQGKKVIKLFTNINKPTPVMILPHKIPMVVKPKLYKWNWEEATYSQLGGYLLNGEMYSNEIILENWELSTKSTLQSDNIICSMINDQ